MIWLDCDHYQTYTLLSHTLPAFPFAQTRLTSVVAKFLHPVAGQRWKETVPPFRLYYFYTDGEWNICFKEE